MNPEAIKAAALSWERARALQKAGRYAEAEPLFRAALKVMPKSAALLADYGKLAEQLNDWRAALQIWQAVAKLDPQRPVDDRLGLALLQLDHPADALPHLEAHAARFPADPDTPINLAVACSRLHRDDEAIAILQRAVTEHPRNLQTWESLVTLLVNAADRNGVADALARARQQFPASTELRYLQMDHLLKCGDFDAGFALFDARWDTRFYGGVRPHADNRRWDGQPFEGQLLIRAEQGVGDELLYSSIFSDAITRHRDTVIECDARLQPLFSRTWPGTSFVPRTLPDSAPEKSGFTRDIMAGDLCRLFRRDASAFPAADRWLAADAERTAALSAAYRARFPGQLLVGISWRSMHPTNGTAKTLALPQLLPLLRVPGVQFIDVQYGDTTTELADLLRAHGVTVHHDPAFDSLKNLDDFAALLAALDLVISTSNSTVHLAGALGVPTWMLMHRDRGTPWYWGYDDTRVPWYRTLEILRCRRRGEWEPVILEAARRLAGMARPTA